MIVDDLSGIVRESGINAGVFRPFLDCAERFLCQLVAQPPVHLGTSPGGMTADSERGAVSIKGDIHVSGFDFSPRIK